MSKTKFVLDKMTKLIEQSLISYKDFSSEMINILKSKRDEIIFKMKITSKEETEVLIKRVDKLEKKIEIIEKKYKKKNYKGKEIITLKPPIFEEPSLIFPPCDLTISEDIDRPKPTLDFPSALLLSIL